MTRGSPIRGALNADDLAINRAVGKRVRDARRRAGLSQDQTAAMVGLTRGSVANIETGRQTLTLPMFLSFCDALSVEPADILGPGAP